MFDTRDQILNQLRAGEGALQTMLLDYRVFAQGNAKNSGGWRSALRPTPKVRAVRR